MKKVAIILAVSCLSQAYANFSLRPQAAGQQAVANGGA